MNTAVRAFQCACMIRLAVAACLRLVWRIASPKCSVPTADEAQQMHVSLRARAGEHTSAPCSSSASSCQPASRTRTARQSPALGSGIVLSASRSREGPLARFSDLKPHVCCSAGLSAGAHSSRRFPFHHSCYASVASERFHSAGLKVAAAYCPRRPMAVCSCQLQRLRSAMGGWLWKRSAAAERRPK